MKTFKLLVILLMTLSLQNCETEVPETDSTPPNFSILISGDGFSRTFTQDDNFDRIQLNLKEGARYNFIFTATDAGGMNLIQWQLDSEDLINLEAEIESPWSIRDLSFLSRMIEWNGNPSAPLTGSALSGIFIPRGISGSNSTSTSFRFYARDYGGESGTPNVTSKELNISIGNQESEIIEF